jgi:hypothetical protein
VIAYNRQLDNEERYKKPKEKATDMRKRLGYPPRPPGEVADIEIEDRLTKLESHVSGLETVFEKARDLIIRISCNPCNRRHHLACREVREELDDLALKIQRLRYPPAVKR